MNSPWKTCVGAAIVLLTLLRSAAAEPLFDYVDNRLSASYVFRATDAGNYTVHRNGSISGTTAMYALEYTHFSAWKFGTNFFYAGLFQSTPSDPAGPCTNAGQIFTGSAVVDADCAGGSDFYGLARSTLGFNEIFNTKMFHIGPLKDVSFEAGLDFDSQNTYYASAKRMFVAGIQFAFDLPHGGYLNAAPLFKFETGHNGFTQCGGPFAAPAPNCNSDGIINYQNTWAFELNYYLPLGFLPESVRYFAISGRAGIYGPKGPWNGLPASVTGSKGYQVEVNTEPVRLIFDAGKAMFGEERSHALDLWVAYRYWQNQYGNPADSAPYVCTLHGVSTNSCTMNAVAAGMTVKF